jgi:hypothetical protein
MYVEIVPPASPVRTRVAGTPHLASPHFGTWLKGQVLPSLEDRIRLDLVPLED